MSEVVLSPLEVMVKVVVVFEEDFVGFFFEPELTLHPLSKSENKANVVNANDFFMPLL